MSVSNSSSENAYFPNRWLEGAYDEAISLDEEGVEALCPSYVELLEITSRYEDQEMLGKGALKVVYRTYDLRTRRWLALARLRDDRGPEYYDLFVHEAWLTASLKHPNIIDVHDTGVDSEGLPFFTMDLKGNQSLADFVKAGQELSSLLIVFSKICDAMAYAHSKGVVHLDLKPENIQVSQFGEVLVCDWGLGKMVGNQDVEMLHRREVAELDNMTLLGQVKGSPGYMAPEQVAATVDKDQRADIFALGCLLHFILTGEAPFVGAVSEVLEKTERAEFPLLKVRFPELKIPASLLAVVVKALALKPRDRYQTALELQDEIQNYLKGYSTAAERPSWLRESFLFVRRNRFVVGVTLLAVMTLTALGFHFGQRLERQNDLASAERDRATEFETEAGKVAGRYQAILDQTEAEKVQFLETLVGSSNRMKNIGIFTRPGFTVRECQKLIDAAFMLDPDHLGARTQQVSLDCITLNFKRVIEDTERFGENDPDYLAYAQAFPAFAYDERRRPSAQDLATFYEKAGEISSEHPFLMERIAAYDFAHHKDRKNYLPVVHALLGYLNGGSDRVELVYDPANSVLRVWSDQKLRTRLLQLRGSGKCLLRFLCFRNLKLELSRPFNLQNLAGLSIETLDLRACEKLIIKQKLDLPNLRMIIMTPAQIDKGLLHEFIEASQPFEVKELAVGQKK